jgi:3-isopropylmalate/(R)-2-methylmalate dehydratase large subunit
MSGTYFEKVWAAHRVMTRATGEDVVFVDRHYVHDLSGAEALEALDHQGRVVARPDLTFGSPDHTIPSARPRGAAALAGQTIRLVTYREQVAKQHIPSFDLDHPSQGIIHVTMPELGLSLPGSIVVCGDSHTCTHGGVGAVAWGIGVSDIAHVLATQTIVIKPPKTLRIWCEGQLPEGSVAKDLALFILAQHGTQFGVGHAIEFAGPAVEALSIEGRLTLCNLSIEMGARIGFVAPDQVTLDWLSGRTGAPKGKNWEKACQDWLSLRSDADAVCDQEIRLDAHQVKPQISWGTSPDQTTGLHGVVPSLASQIDAKARERFEKSLAYMGLTPGQALTGTPIDRVFIGACTNSRLSDLELAAEVVKGRRVAAHVEAWVVPGSRAVADAAEAKGLDVVFRQAGFQWREPGCSMCVGANGDIGQPGQRVVSTSNRNFVGRQGPGVRTHLASPATAAASAIAGVMTTAGDLA